MYDVDALMLGLQNLFTPYMLMLVICGFILGFVVGAIPGFNDAILMSILLPFTLYLDPAGAIVALAALYAASQTAGAIPAILLNVPGTPGNAATVLEGYPFARQGRAGEALGIAFAASAVGAVLGGLGSLLVAPVVGSFALSFGPAEMFLIGTFGLTVVAALTGDSLAKGLLAAALGFLLSLIGADSMTAFPRGTFGLYALYDGLPLIPMLLGLFGVSEMMVMMAQRSVARTAENQSGYKDIMRGVWNTFRHWGVLIHSAVIGLIVGFIPGPGATIGSFVAYGQARQWSRHPEKFGKGSSEGLTASETANNAVAAGAVVPVLTLGLPGSASATILLAALFLQGIVPGPRLFMNFQVEAYTILLSFILCGIMCLAIGVPLARLFQRVMYIPTAYMIPLVSVILFTGAFGWRFNPFDIIIMIAFGIIGILFKIYNYSIPALLLGAIIGSMMESNFLRAERIGGYEYIYQSSASKVIIGIIVITLFLPLIMSFFRGRKTPDLSS